MNYISEINNFYDWLETNPISDSSIVLWHALMHINNKCGWKPEFAVALSTIQNKTGLSASSVERARKKLAEAGRIKFNSRPGRQSAVYTILVLHGDGQSEGQTEGQSNTSGTPDIVVRHTDGQSEGQSEVQTIVVRQPDAQSEGQTEGQGAFVRHSDGQTVGITKLNYLNKNLGGFFKIGTEQILGKPSDRIKSDHTMVTDSFMMTLFRGLDKAKVLERMDNEYMGYEFKDEMHLRNSFKSVAEKMLRESKPKPVWNAKPEAPAGDNSGFVLGSKPRGAVRHG